jgi:hypothetical protein
MEFLRITGLVRCLRHFAEENGLATIVDTKTAREALL